MSTTNDPQYKKFTFDPKVPEDLVRFRDLLVEVIKDLPDCSLIPLGLVFTNVSKAEMKLGEGLDMAVSFEEMGAVLENPAHPLHTLFQKPAAESLITIAYLIRLMAIRAHNAELMATPL